MKLPRPIYEALPFFLVGVGILFISLVLNWYEYAPTLFIWLLGIFCILGGLALFAVRLVFRIKHRAEQSYAEEES